MKIEKKRHLFNEVNFDNKLIGIIGDRGIGKTTFLLQYLKELDLPSELTSTFKPFAFWKEYLEYGYYPYYFETQKESFLRP